MCVQKKENVHTEKIKVKVITEGMWQHIIKKFHTCVYGEAFSPLGSENA